MKKRKKLMYGYVDGTDLCFGWERLHIFVKWVPVNDWRIKDFYDSWLPWHVRMWMTSFHSVSKKSNIKSWKMGDFR